MPVLENTPTLDTMKQGWEEGFLQKATRKLSSESVVIGGQTAHQVRAEVDAADGATYEVVGILIVAGGWNYSLGITKRGGGALDDPEARAFLGSFRVVGVQ